MSNKIAIFSPSHYCNSQCWMCTDLWTSIDKYIEPNFDILCKDVENLKREGVTSLHISGGEPTVWKKFDDFISFVATIGFSNIAIYSNGRTLTKRKIEHCLNNGVNLFLISLHAADETKGDDIAKAPNSFNQTLKGLENLSSFKSKFSFEISISCVPSKLTETEVLKMALLASKFNIDNFQLTYPVNTSLTNLINDDLFPDLKIMEKQFTSLFKLLLEKNINPAINEIPPCYYKPFANYYSAAYKHEDERILIGYHTRNGAVQRDMYTPLESTKMYFYAKDCDKCYLKSICSGIPNVYKTQYQDGELSPFTEDEVIDIIRGRE